MARTTARYLVAGATGWNRQVFHEVMSHYPGTWRLINRPEQLTIQRVRRFAPRYLFFLHWSWKVPDEIVNAYPCIGFHMTDLPYGRGGSPLQNLILRGHRQTQLTAFRLTTKMDAGPVYLKRRLTLDGSADTIYRRGSLLAVRMIRRLITGRLMAAPQRGRVVVFKRRQPEQSLIPALPTAQRLYDFIRMLDADGYPHAFLSHQGFRYVFSKASRKGGRLAAQVEIMPIEQRDS